ncbi:MAG: hypothetical protein ACF8PN_08085 [Phycisphaerales bacterium]
MALDPDPRALTAQGRDQIAQQVADDLTGTRIVDPVTGRRIPLSQTRWAPTGGPVPFTAPPGPVADLAGRLTSPQGMPGRPPAPAPGMSIPSAQGAGSTGGAIAQGAANAEVMGELGPTGTAARRAAGPRAQSLIGRPPGPLPGGDAAYARQLFDVMTPGRRLPAPPGMIGRSGPPTPTPWTIQGMRAGVAPGPRNPGIPRTLLPNAGRFGRWAGRGATIAAPFAVQTLGALTGNESVERAGTAMIPASLAGLAPAAATGLGVALGDWGGGSFTEGAGDVARGVNPIADTDWSSPTDVMGLSGRLAGGIGGALAMPAAASGIPGVSDVASRVLEGERDLGDVFGAIGGFFGEEGPSTAELAAQQARQAQRGSTEWAGQIGAQYGLTPEGVDQLTDDIDTTKRQMAALNEAGMLGGWAEIDGQPVLVSVDDERLTTGEIDPASLTPLTEDDINIIAVEQGLQTLPTIDAEIQAAQDQMARAAAYQMMLSNYVEPMIAARGPSAADLYSQAGLPEMAAAQTVMDTALQNQLVRLPTDMAAQEAADAQAAFDAQVASQILSAEAAAAAALARPDLFADAGDTADTLADRVAAGQ